MLFAELVNNGDSFNGCYIDQVNDIDMTDTSFFQLDVLKKIFSFPAFMMEMVML